MDKKALLLKALLKISNKKGKYVFPKNFTNAIDYIVSQAFEITAGEITKEDRELALKIIEKNNINFKDVEFISAL